MKLNSFLKNIGNLICAGHKWQYAGLSGRGEEPKLYFSSVQYAFIIISFCSVFWLPAGFNKDFIGYFIATLAIFVGLFMSMIMSYFDRFQKIDFKVKLRTENEKTSQKLSLNFLQQFLILNSYAVLISVGCIFLLSLSLLSDSPKINTEDYVFSFESVTTKSLLAFMKILIVIIYRCFVIYFLLDFIYLVTISVGKLFEHMNVEFDKAKRIIRQREEGE